MRGGFLLSWHVGHQTHLAGAFDGGGNAALVLGAEAGLFLAFDFVEPRNIAHELLYILKVYLINIFLAEVTHSDLEWNIFNVYFVVIV